MGADADPRGTPEIPNKLYFRIGEVSRLAGVQPYVLRYWETEFPGLAPRKSESGQRLYRRKEVETALQIRKLLYDERFTIEGARRHLAARAKAAQEAESQPEVDAAQGELFPSANSVLLEVRRELDEILSLLK